ncbi:Uncharacterised protein [uncultured archaeon]|nr:Uncharacterised protein [uncultured archaeon]
MQENTQLFKAFKTFENGSTSVRIDFHLHTRADDKGFYKGEDNQFVKDYIDKLKQENIQVGIIANHNKFDRNEFQTLKKSAKKEEIFLLPGIELSVNDGANGIHILVVFGDRWLENSIDYINQFLANTFRGKENYENINERSNDSLVNTIELLDGYNKDYFIILAHIEQKSGFYEELKGGRITELGKNQLFRRAVLGFQKVRTRDIENNLKQWLGEDLPAFVEGSDPKNIEEIGKGEKSYIKIGDFNFEAIKFALFDHEYRIKKLKPEPENSYIKSISFEGGLLNGNTINLSSDLNNFIGIRGSGKSSIIEALRYALDIGFGFKAMDTDYKEKLVRYVLGSGGKITIEVVDRYKKEYRIEKIYNQKSDIFLENELVPEISTEAIINKPIYFGQKDLSNTGEGFEQDLINKLIGNKLKDIQKAIEKKQWDVINHIHELKKLKEIENKKEEILSQKADVQHKLKIYKEYGVEERLKKQVNFNKDNVKFNEIFDFISIYVDDIEKINIEYLERFETITHYESIENKELFDEMMQIFNSIKSNFEELKGSSQFIRIKLEELQQIINKFQLKQDQLKEEFARIQREIKIPNINPDDFVKLNASLNLIDLKVNEIEKSSEKKTTIEKNLLLKLKELNDVWLEEYRFLSDEILKINDNQKSLKIEIEFKGDKNDYKKFLQKMFKGSGLYEKDFTEIVNKSQDCIEIYKVPSIIESILKDNKLLNFNNILQENLQAFLTYKVPNKYIIKYRDKELKEHSLGQRASALILFILSQKENDVIIIDQPEDDLDNQTIYEDVIKHIKNLKTKVQFIFATHNANIPVLGDSEQVIACEYKPETITPIIGSIDNKIIQEKIVHIMEGGSEAFNRRKEIYHLWKQ